MRYWKSTILAGMLAASMSPALAAPNFLGQSGNIVTPDDIVVLKGEFSASYHYLERRIFGRGDPMSIFAGNLGVTPALELGFAFVEQDNTRFLVNGKYQLLSERRDRPSVTVGVVDLLISSIRTRALISSSARM